MILDTESYVLSKNNYIEVETTKKRIVLANTFNNGMNHFIGWKLRYGGKYKKTAPYTISKDGTVYRHFDPKFCSRFFTDNDLNATSIVVLIENEGWLTKYFNEDKFIGIIGNIYSQDNEIYEKKWRTINHWLKYSDEQFYSCIELVKKLCIDFNIPLSTIGHNTMVDNIQNYSGIIYRSNLERHYTDLNPSWDFQTFKNKIEKT
jgi:N-acetyl-anhydromuramyl-L-alanine amidase AmpD